MDSEQPQERYQPLALIGVTLIALLGFAVFFLSFLVAPLAILLIFYVGFAASDRSKRNGSAPAAEDEDEPQDDEQEVVVDETDRRAQALAREAQYRRQQLDRATLEQSHDAAEPR
jgi:hypothetical protein